MEWQPAIETAGPWAFAGSLTMAVFAALIRGALVPYQAYQDMRHERDLEREGRREAEKSSRELAVEVAKLSGELARSMRPTTTTEPA